MFEYTLYMYSLITTDSSTDTYHGYYSNDDLHTMTDITVNNYSVKLNEDFLIYFRYVEGTDLNTFLIVNEDGVSITNNYVYFNYYRTAKINNDILLPIQIYFVY